MGIVAAAPKFAALHATLLLNSLEHGFSAFWACWSSAHRRLIFSSFKSLDSHIFRKAAHLSKGLKLALNLSLKHFVFSQTHYQERIGSCLGS